MAPHRERGSSTPAIAAVIPGLHDFHIHLVGLAADRSAIAPRRRRRRRRGGRRIADGAGDLAADAWLTGRGWSEAPAGGARRRRRSTPRSGERLAFSDQPRRPFGLGVTGRAPPRRPRRRRRSDPAGGRIERDAAGEPTGVLRETAMDLVAPLVPEPAGRGAARRPRRDAPRAGRRSASPAPARRGTTPTDNGIGADAAHSATRTRP